MSKGNVLLGMARGAVGDIVFSRLKGQQVARARNRQPANPRTSSQMYQRALFTDAVKFYTRGRRNLFQFAFENKKANESDYNAFMRENAKRGVVISKAAFDNYGYPALGNFIMSKGTLPPMVESNLTNRGMSVEKVFSASEAPAVATIGDISRILIDGVDTLEGDILTFVTIVVNDNTNVPSVDGEGGNTQWIINQIQLDANSTQPLSDYGLSATQVYSEGSAVVDIVQKIDTILNTSIAAGVVIHSRNTANGVRVSTEELALNSVATTAIEAARQRSYIDAVVESWRITQQAPIVSEAVMQGSIAQSIAADFEPGE